MRQSRTLSIGVDVHTDSMAVADVAQEHGAAVICLGALGTRQGALDPRLRQRPSKAPQRLLVSEAGPCGDWLSRSFTQTGDDCWVVAPSLVPQKAGDRVNTDRRDAMPRARLARSGDLTVVDVPQVEAEAIRDRTRAREETLSALQDATCRRQAFCLRHASRSTGRAPWSPAPLRWRAEGVCPPPAPHLVLQASVRAVNEPPARLQRLEPARHEPVPSWRLHPGLEPLQAWRGVPCPVAVPMVAAGGDLSRVDPPRERMNVWGWIPSESASGERRQQGSLTNAGHTPARRARVAGAWAYRAPAKVSRHLQRRLETPPNAIQAIRWKAQGRLCTRDRRRVAKGQQANVVTVAMAREVVGFLWAMATAVPGTP